MKNHLFIILFFVTVLSACEKTLDVNLSNKDAQNKLVVNACFEADSLFQIHVSKSSGVFTADAPSILATAEVELWQNGVMLGLMKHDSAGYYSFNNSTKILPESTYQIKASASGLPSVNAEDKIPQKPEITLVSLDTILGKIEFTLADKLETNYYIFYLSAIDKNNGTIYPINFETTSSALAGTEINIDAGGDQSNKKPLPNVVSDALFNNTKAVYTLYFNTRLYDYKHSHSQNLNPVYFSNINLNFGCASISSNLAAYLKYEELYSNSQDDPFAEPVQIETNVKNGFGIVGSKNNFQIKLQ
ncbi:MAG: hypothetical protein RIQ33_1938 [Bacteroidota bacterium]|jgi:hypothetical protein